MFRVQRANYAKALGLLLLFAAAMTYELHAQRMTYRITFTDKGQEEFVPGSALYQTTLNEFHEDALERRERSGRTPLLDTRDQPISAPYLTQLNDLGVTPMFHLRWWNAIIVELDTLSASQIAQLPFVERLERTSDVNYAPMGTPDNCAPAKYGPSEPGHNLINTQPLHDAGVFGQGARIALLDNGFRTANMSSLDHLTIDGQYDAIYGDDDVSNGPDDPSNQDGHGSLVLSIAAGWHQDSLIGVAPFSSYLLAKTEDMRYERRIEEDLYCAGIEWAERNGAFVTSSSLGYFPFDSTEQESEYAFLDGKTTFADQTLNHATSLGMVCVTAAGNYGPRDSSIIIPAAADSVVAVGATLRSGRYWPASSFGVTPDGREKPDLAVWGAGVRGQNIFGNFIRASGTSMATPQVAASFGLLHQIYPDVESWKLRQAVLNSCRYLDEIAVQLGRGIPDITSAARSLGDEEGPGIGPPTVANVGTQRMVFASVFSNDFTETRLIINDNSQTRVIGQRVVDDWFEFRVDSMLFESDSIQARILSIANGVERYYPSDSTWFFIPRQQTVSPCGVRLPGSIVSVENSQVASVEAPIETRVAPTPTPRGSRQVQLFTHMNVNALRLVETSTGVSRSLAFSQLSSGALSVVLPDLSAGHYQVVLIGSDSIEAAPLIVY